MYKKQIYKEASAAYVKGIKGVTDAVSRFAKSSPTSASKLIRKNMNHGGSGSFYGDIVLGGLKKIPGPYKNKMGRQTLLKEMKSRGLKGSAKKTFVRENADILKRTNPLDSKIDDVVWNAKKNLDDIDMRIGSRLGKNNRIFDASIDINHGPGAHGEVIQRLKTKRATAPLSKAKKAVLPMVGAMTIGEKLAPSEKQVDSRKEGDRFEQRSPY